MTLSLRSCTEEKEKVEDEKTECAQDLFGGFM